MRQVRVRLKFATSLCTPLQADTVFGHFCWAIRYHEGTGALSELLKAFETDPPLVISDGFPALEDRFYLPKPLLPLKPAHRKTLADKLGVTDGDRETYRKFSAALKSLQRTEYVESGVLARLTENLSLSSLYDDCFSLNICPKSMAPRRPERCGCKSWLECPALGNEEDKSVSCSEIGPASIRVLTMHNTVGRWTNSAINLFAQEEVFPNHSFHFFVRLNDSLFTEGRLRSCLEYLEHSGFGRDSSTGKGAIQSWQIEDLDEKSVSGANAFINLSSAYVPRAGEIKDGQAWYSVDVKRGKVGGDYVLTYPAWKQPVLMLKAGSVIMGDPDSVHGCLVKNIHRQIPEVVQYGYAYPMGAKLDVKAL